MNVTLGGMGLRDGVLLQSERFWAAAVRQPGGGVNVTSGVKPRLPGRESLSHVPVLRGLARLAESVSALPGVRRANGGPVLPLEDPRLFAAAGVSVVVTLVLRNTRRGSPLLNELVAAVASLAPVLLLLRDSRLARYHGAEHKSVAAYETGGAAAAAGKEHARCGSNLIVPVAVASAASNLALRALGKERKPVATLVAGLVSLGSAMELFSWMARHQEHPLARALQRPGVELQRLFTTSEPSEDQLDVADLALCELLRLEGTAPPAAAGA
jgi:uncharacterized protein YqhQ